MTKIQTIIFFSVFGILFLYLDSLDNKEGKLVMLVVMGIGVLFLLFPVAHVSETIEENLAYPEDENNNEEEQEHVLVYEGSSLHFPDDEMVNVLNKHFPYYTKLGYDDKLKFFHRLKNFISKKTFVIHDESGFKEMPILISASAIQLSFGLDKYLLPFLSHVHIFPEEFIGYHPTIRLLEGNVSGHSINLSWKHFMDGYKYPDNGQNVGLHEFAHAFYYQYFEVGENVEHDFVAAFPSFNSYGNKAFEQEQQPGNDLYSDYALTNFQEFWAESVEVFFEKPVLLKAIYPDLFEAITEILKQDPIKSNTV
jgi:Mlc titration factor MtfA (ptsG expression regulator)